MFKTKETIKQHNEQNQHQKHRLLPNPDTDNWMFKDRNQELPLGIQCTICAYYKQSFLIDLQ